MKRRWHEAKPRILGTILYYVLRMLVAPLRLRIVRLEGSPEPGTPAIPCMWHGRTVIPAGRKVWKMPVSVIISHSRDGEMQATIYRRLGYDIIRGSTGRGGARAAVEAIRALKNGATLALTPDGPRGPSGVVQEGIVFLAHKSGRPLVPLGVSCRPRILAKSWDRYLIPIPFGRAVVVIGRAITVPPGADADTLERVRLELQEALHDCERQAERMLGY